MKSTKKPKGKKAARKENTGKPAKKVANKLGARVKASSTKTKAKVKRVTAKKPTPKKRVARHPSAKKLKTKMLASAEREERLNEILPSEPAPTVPDPTQDVVPEVASELATSDPDDLDDEAPPPYEDPDEANDWRGPFVEPAPVGWKSKRLMPGYKVA